MNHIEGIEVGLEKKVPYHEIARKIYLTYPTNAFVGDEESQFEIFNQIATFFDVPITAIQVAGSAKTGRSFHKGKNFVAGESDLDIAIIDARLFTKYSETVFLASKRHSDLSAFAIKDGKHTFDEYTRCLARGIFRPDLMASGPDRARIGNFFGGLSIRYSKLFCSINAAIYLSQIFFECKQRSSITKYVENRPVQ